MTAPQRILVTGAGGFVCSHMVEVLLAAGRHVVGMDQAFDPDLKDAWMTRWPDQIELIETTLDQVPDTQVDSVIHGAAITARPEEVALSPEGYVRASIEPTLTLLEWARDHCAGRFVFISSSAVFRQTQQGPVDETMPAAPYGLYAVAKYTTETLLDTLCQQYERDLVAVRLSNLYGSRERTRPTRPRRGLLGEMIESAVEHNRIVVYEQDPARDWTYVPDIGRAMLTLLNMPELKQPLYHVAAEQVVLPLEMAQAIQRIIPGVTIECRAGLDPRGKKLTQQGYLSSERFRTETGFDEWTPFEQGLREAIEQRRHTTEIVR
jgi:nucleoside-diphosphate-sugar epimerase